MILAELIIRGKVNLRFLLQVPQKTNKQFKSIILDYFY